MTGVPPIDSLNMWDYVTGATPQSPRTEIPLVSGTNGALIVGDYKIVRGSQVGVCGRSHSRALTPRSPRISKLSPFFPRSHNRTTPSGLAPSTPTAPPTTSTRCVRGAQHCHSPLPANPLPGLPPAQPAFNCGKGCLFNIIEDPTEHNDLAASMPDKLAELLQRAEELDKTAYLPNRGSGNRQQCCEATKKYGGFTGPYLDQ